MSSYIQTQQPGRAHREQTLLFVNFSLAALQQSPSNTDTALTSYSVKFRGKHVCLKPWPHTSHPRRSLQDKVQHSIFCELIMRIQNNAHSAQFICLPIATAAVRPKGWSRMQALGEPQATQPNETNRNPDYTACSPRIYLARSDPPGSD